MEYVEPIGINLGTTYSSVGVWYNERVEIIANDQGNLRTPSYVAFTDTEQLVGEAAQQQAESNPANTVYDMMMLIGRDVAEQPVQCGMKQWPFKVMSKADGHPLIKVRHMGETKLLTPEEITAMLLVKMKEIAEAFLGRKVYKAVATVPAYFNDPQRRALKKAMGIAGLEVMRIINEPTAAAIAYGLGNYDGERTVLIYDVGGRTVDVTLLNIEDGIFEVYATAGDSYLGGEDFDHCMMNHFVKEFKRMHGRDLTQSSRALRRLRVACERAKRGLSSASQTCVEIDSLLEGVDFCASITREKFEELNADLFRACLRPIERVLHDMKMDKKLVHDVILIGGSTCIPKIREMVSEFFGGKELAWPFSPDEAVARGAATQAIILTGRGREQACIPFDVTPLTLGIETAGGLVSPVIERNTAIPVSRILPCSTLSDNQHSMLIAVYEGMRPRARDCVLLGTLHLTGIPPAPRGVPQIDVTFNLDANGVLTVSAEDKVTGQVVVTSRTGGESNTQEIEQKIVEAQDHDMEDQVERERVEAWCRLHQSAYLMRGKVVEESMDTLTACERERITEACSETLKWLDTAKEAPKEEYESRLNVLEQRCRPLSLPCVMYPVPLVAGPPSASALIARPPTR